MEVTKENLECAYKHMSSQWDFIGNIPIKTLDGLITHLLSFMREIWFMSI